MAGMNMMGRPGSSSQQQLFQNNLARMQGNPNMGMIWIKNDNNIYIFHI